MVHSPPDFGVCFIDSIWAPSFSETPNWKVFSIFEKLSSHFPVVTAACGYPELSMNVPVVVLLLLQPFPFNKQYIIWSFWWLLQKCMRCLNQEGHKPSFIPWRLFLGGKPLVKMAFAVQVLSFPTVYAEVSRLQEPSYEGGKELNQWFVAVYLATGCYESWVNVWPSSMLSRSITAMGLTLWSACSVGQERPVVDSMRPVPYCDLLWQARSLTQRVNGKIQPPLVPSGMAEEKGRMEGEQEGEDVCKRPAALTFLWIKHKVFSVLPRRPHLLILHAHIGNKMPRLLDMLTWMCFYEECRGLTGGCLLLYFFLFKVFAWF